MSLKSDTRGFPRVLDIRFVVNPQDGALEGDGQSVKVTLHPVLSNPHVSSARSGGDRETKGSLSQLNLPYCHTIDEDPLFMCMLRKSWCVFWIGMVFDLGPVQQGAKPIVD